ncbi:hypothetical protein D9613_003593 [Agrocybe pediades]|uniref:Uncharacterized protein n=1 Tax=Agrocybe pediades TaxID=84607 RepID=A0A8H4VL16_9AGAR|nr:hypothetical protein D9613_003593 [Agrocybe pediades]
MRVCIDTALSPVPDATNTMKEEPRPKDLVKEDEEVVGRRGLKERAYAGEKSSGKSPPSTTFQEPQQQVVFSISEPTPATASNSVAMPILSEPHPLPADQPQQYEEHSEPNTLNRFLHLPQPGQPSSRISLLAHTPTRSVLMLLICTSSREYGKIEFQVGDQAIVACATFANAEIIPLQPFPSAVDCRYRQDEIPVFATLGVAAVGDRVLSAAMGMGCSIDLHLEGCGHYRMVLFAPARPVRQQAITTTNATAVVSFPSALERFSLADGDETTTAATLTATATSAQADHELEKTDGGSLVTGWLR